MHDRAGDLPPDTPVRLRIEQVSAVEHAIAVGVPRRDTDGGVRMTEGLGRPLIVTTLEPSEAMRILGEGRTTRPLVAAICLAAGMGLVSIGLAAAIIGLVL